MTDHEIVETCPTCGHDTATQWVDARDYIEMANELQAAKDELARVKRSLAHAEAQLSYVPW